MLNVRVLVRVCLPGLRCFSSSDSCFVLLYLLLLRRQKEDGGGSTRGETEEPGQVISLNETHAGVFLKSDCAFFSVAAALKAGNNENREWRAAGEKATRSEQMKEFGGGGGYGCVWGGECCR